MSVEEAVLHLRRQDQHRLLIRDAYLDADAEAAAIRFSESHEFLETWELLKDASELGLLIDVGAGRGIASFAMASRGAYVLAAEPDISPHVGATAAISLLRDLDAEVVCAALPSLPLADRTCAGIYLRQVLHHLSDLRSGIQELARVLEPGGILVAAREHVVDDQQQLQAFLAHHPIHQLAGGEGAFPLNDYVDAIRDAGLRIEAVLGPWDSVINAFPVVTTPEELRDYPVTLLRRRLGSSGKLIQWSRFVQKLVSWRVNRPVPGRMFTFVARKPRSGE